MKHGAGARGGPAKGRAAKGAKYLRTGTVDELTDQNVRTIIDLERAAKQASGTADTISSAIARFCGSMTFVLVHVVWFGAWIAFNAWPGLPHPDPFPFTFLTLVVSLEAIFLSTFLLMSQNQENRLTERRSQLDLQINLLTEQENTKMLEMLQRIAEKVGASAGDDPDLEVLEKATRPEKLLEQIEKASQTPG